MSIIKYFDAPHIIRFGMTDDDLGKSEIQLWRNGVHFTIMIDKADVKGTDFERHWTPLLNTEPFLLHIDRWDRLCSLVISQCMGVLQELAPNKSYWTSIYDYLHVGSYVLRLYGAPGADVIPQVVQGPTITCAYETQPAARNKFTIPDDLPIFDSRVVIPVDHEHDFKNLPRKVILPDKKMAFFLPCKISTRRWDGSRFIDGVNESHQAISSYLVLDSMRIQHNSAYARIPKVLGIIYDSVYPGTNTQREEGQENVAGILLEWIDGFRLANLNLVANRNITARDDSIHEKWREQLIGIIKELHHHGVSALGVDINPFNIIIDRNDGQAWLTGFINCEVSDDYSAEDVIELESEQIRLVFGQWLSAEVKVSVSASDPEGIRKGAISRWFAISDS